MNVFIAGGTGVLGRRVVRRLVDAGHHVVGLSRSPENAALLAELGAEPREGNLFDTASIERVTADCDAILHLATSIPTKVPSRRADWRMNDRIRTEGTRNLIRAAIAHKCKVYVQESVLYVYGDRGGAWIDEHTPLAPKLGGVLASALEMEHLVRAAVDEQHLPAITLRFGTFYGPDAAHTQATLDLVEQGKFPILGDGETFWNMIHLNDAALAVVEAVENHATNLGQAFHIVDGSPVHQRELATGLAELLIARPPKHLPLWLARLYLGRDQLEPLLMSYRANHDTATWRLGWTPRYPDFRFGHQATIKARREELVAS